MSALPLETLCQVLAELAPLRLAESWDNVGLLVGNRAAPIHRVMTCLTITPAVVAEAAERQAELIVTHHPLPFKPLAKITSDSPNGQMLLDLIAGGVAVYSAHTAFDSALLGINAMWSEALELQDMAPLVPQAEDDDPGSGSGRCGRLAADTPVTELAATAAGIVGVDEVRIAGPIQTVRKVGIACGSGGGFLHAAAHRGCQVLITGEATFHTCLEAEARGITLILLGHYGSERFAMERLAGLLRERLQSLCDTLEVFASDADVDPLRTIRPPAGQR